MSKFGPAAGRSGGRRVLCVLPLVLLLSTCRAGTVAPTTAVAEPGQAVQEGDLAAPGEVLPPGDTRRTLSFGALERSYLLHIPAGYDATRPTPLVLAFHGFGLDAEEMARISALSAQADGSGFVVAYPNGTGENWSWNGGHCCGEAAARNADDVGFVRALIDELAAIVNLDTARVYATGFSNGSLFAYQLACRLSDRIAAIGPVGATQVRDDQEACQPGRGVPVIHFHGTADRLNPYEGATTAAGYEFLSVENAIAHWTRANGCPAEPRESRTGNIEHAVYAPCMQNAAVELYTIVDGEHAWPGGEAVSAQVGEPTMEISASQLMWEFFSAHPLP